MTIEQSQLSKKSPGDFAHALAKAGLSTIPVIGGPAVELFQLVVQSPLDKRREAWMTEVGNKLRELEANGLNLSDLQKNEQFVSAVMQASQAALRTHKAEKLAALRNAIINVARGQSPDETVQHLLLSFIDSMSEMHLRILKVFHAPSPPPGLSFGGLGDVIEHQIPELTGRQDLYRQLCRDLYADGLFNTENIGVTMSANGLGQRRTTDLGEVFLRFINEAGPYGDSAQ